MQKRFAITQFNENVQMHLRLLKGEIDMNLNETEMFVLIHMNQKSYCMLTV